MANEERDVQRCRPILLADPIQVASEVEKIRKLTPQKGLDSEERQVRNAQVRGLLTSASNEAILELYRQHQLSRVELVGRLRRHDPFAPESLARVIVTGADSPNSLPKGERNLFELALQNIVEVLPVVKPERAVDSLSGTFPTVGRPNGAVIEYLLRTRPDAVSIAELLAIRLGEEPVLKGVRRNLTHEMDTSARDYVEFFLTTDKPK